jgi:hypothetical protein
MTLGTAPGASRETGENAPGNPRSGGFGLLGASPIFQAAGCPMMPENLPREPQEALEMPSAKNNGRRPWVAPRLTPGPEGLNISEEGAYVLAYPA